MFKEEPIFEEQINLEDLVFSTQEINDVVETIKHESKEVVFKVSDKKTKEVQTPNIVQNIENEAIDVISYLNENSKNCQTFQKEHLKEVKLENLNKETAFDQTINEPTKVIAPVDSKTLSFANKFEQFALQSFQKEGNPSSDNNTSFEKFAKIPKLENEYDYDSVSNNGPYAEKNNFPAVHAGKKPFQEGQISSDGNFFESSAKKVKLEAEYNLVSNSVHKENCLDNPHDVINNVAAVHDGKKPFSFQERGKISSHGNSIESSAKKFESESSFVPNNESNNHFAFSNGVINNISAVHEGKKPFSCKNCSKEFDSKQSVKRHIAAVHEGKKPYSCTTCKKVFESKHNVKRHVAAVHEGKKPYSCTICKKAFGNEHNVKKHVDSVHKGLKFSCSYCGISYSDNYRLKKHIFESHESNPVMSNNKKIESTLANGRSAVIAANTKYQSASVHEVKKPFQCKICDKSYGVSYSLKKHIGSVHEGIKFPCTFCNNIYRGKSELTRHIKKVHESTSASKKEMQLLPINSKKSVQTLSLITQIDPGDIIQTIEAPQPLNNSVPNPSFNTLVPKLTSSDLVPNPNLINQIGPRNIIKAIEEQPVLNHEFEKKFLCIICFQSFQDKLELALHNKKVHNTITFDCVICGKPHIDKQDLSKHSSEVHAGKKSSFQLHCYVCEDKYYTLIDLKNHVELVHEGKCALNIGSVFDCGICGKPHIDKQDLSKHTTEVHEGKISSLHLHCYVCNDKYYTLIDLRNHIKLVHEFALNIGSVFDCVLCGKPQMNKQDLSKHVSEIHEGKNPSQFQTRQCYICNKEYSYIGDLKNHILSVHAKKLHQCALCDKTFAEKNLLNLHVDSFHQLQPFSISNNVVTPNEPTIQKDDLKTQSSNNQINSAIPEENEQKTSGFQCIKCCADFSDESNLNSHVALVHERRNPFTEKIQFKASEEVEFKTLKRKFKCKLCELQFKQKRSLNCHLAKIHGEIDSKTLKCNICDKIFGDNFHMKKHVKSVHEGKNPKQFKCKLWACYICNEKCLNFDALKNHIGSVHEGKKELLQPSSDFTILNESTETKLNVGENFHDENRIESNTENQERLILQTGTVHNRINSAVHEEKEQKPQGFQCNKRSASFTDESNLNAHTAMVHDRISPFSKKIKFKAPKQVKRKQSKCKLCGSQFNDLRNLNFHMARIHGEVDPKILKCNICNQLCRDNCDMKKHMKIHETKKVFDNVAKSVHEVEKPFLCPICSASFSCEKNLRIHGQFSHEIEKSPDEPTIQEMSNISYDKKKQSNNQSATVHEVEKPFSCSLCNAAFKCEKNLRIHEQFSHEIEKSPNEPTIQVLPNISQKNLQLLEKSVATIHKDKILTGQAIDLPNEANTFSHEQVHLHVKSLDDHTVEDFSNISPNNSQLMEKSVTIYEDKICTVQAIDTPNEKNTFPHEQVHLQVEKSSDGHTVEVLKKPVMKMREDQAKEFIDLSNEENSLSHKHVHLQVEKFSDDCTVEGFSNISHNNSIVLEKPVMTIYEEEIVTDKAQEFINLSNEESTNSHEQVILQIEKPPDNPTIKPTMKVSSNSSKSISKYGATIHEETTLKSPKRLISNELLQASTVKYSIMKENNAYEKAGAIRANLINEKINSLNIKKKNNANEKVGAVRANLIDEKIKGLNIEKKKFKSNEEKILSWLQCVYCFANFKCQQDLMNHLMIRHVGKNSSLCTCSICNQYFPNSSLLAKHKMTVHEGKKLYCLEVTNIP